MPVETLGGGAVQRKVSANSAFSEQNQAIVALAPDRWGWRGRLWSFQRSWRCL